MKLQWQVTFKQIVHIWSLAESDKGSSLIEDLVGKPEQLVETINQQLLEPHGLKFDRNFGAHLHWESGVRPEKKLQTIISIAVRIKSIAILKIVEKYTDEVVEFWIKHSPYSHLATNIISESDQINWPRFNKLEIGKKT